MPDEERGSSPILGAGVLDVPSEIWGHFYEPFPRCPNCLILRTRIPVSAFSECATRLGESKCYRCYGHLIGVRNHPFITNKIHIEMSGN